ncbi:MAG TPA: hypothetical protein VKN99_03570 [Polyangia bacterium]|nr:hypothetical protein [Polyangia bacterium]
MADSEAPSDLVEIYHTDDALEADAIRDEVLLPNQVECVILDRTSHPFNTPTMSGALFIAVPRADAEQARALVREAREAGVISSEGDFV